MEWLRRLRGRSQRDGGVTTVEYGLIIAGVAIVAIPAILFLRSSLSSGYEDTYDSVEGACAGAGCNPYNFTDDGIPNRNALAFSPGYSDIVARPGVAISSQTPAVTGAYGTVSYSISPAAPAGLSFSTSSGTISGVPESSQPQTSYTVTASDSGGATGTSDTFLISVNPTISLADYAAIDCYISPSTKSPACGTITRSPAVSDASGNVTYSLSSALPSGLSLDTSTGVISGTPTVTVSPAITRTITATDSEGFSDTGTISIRVRNN